MDLREFEAWLKKKHTTATAGRYLRGVEVYMDVVGGDAALHARYRDIWDYIGELRKAKYSYAHIQTELAAIKAFYRYLVHTGERADNPTRNVYLNDKRFSGRQVQHQDLFSRKELEMLLDRPSRYALLEARSKLALSLYIYQGLTTGEMAHLRVADLNLDEGTVYVAPSRKLNSRILPLERKQVDYADRYIYWERPRLLVDSTETLFITKLGNPEPGENLHYLIESQRDLFPERTLNPKTVRQSAIVNWFREGHGVKDVQIMAGHKYPSTTERYKPTDLAQLKEAIDRFHPLGGK